MKKIGLVFFVIFFSAVLCAAEEVDRSLSTVYVKGSSRLSVSFIEGEPCLLNEIDNIYGAPVSALSISSNGIKISYGCGIILENKKKEKFLVVEWIDKENPNLWYVHKVNSKK